MIASKGDRELSKLIVDAVSQAPLIKVERGTLSHSYLEVPLKGLSSMAV